MNSYLIIKMTVNVRLQFRLQEILVGIEHVLSTMYNSSTLKHLVNAFTIVKLKVTENFQD